MQITLPEMGESVTEGSVVEWRKKIGDWVEAGEPLVEVTTDKVDVEVPSPAAGRLSTILANPGATIAVGASLGEIDTAAGQPNGSAASSSAPPAALPAPVEVVLPEMGESVTEGAVVEWRKNVGDLVAAGDPLVEITTDKVDVEVTAPAAGRLVDIRIAAGATAPVGAVLAVIDAAAHDAGAAPAPVSYTHLTLPTILRV